MTAEMDDEVREIEEIGDVVTTPRVEGPANGPDKTRQSKKQSTHRGVSNSFFSFHLSTWSCLIISLFCPHFPCFAMRGKSPIPTWAAWSELLACAGGGTLRLLPFLPSSARPAVYSAGSTCPVIFNLVVSNSDLPAFWAHLLPPLQPAYCVGTLQSWYVAMASYRVQ